MWQKVNLTRVELEAQEQVSGKWKKTNCYGILMFNIIII